MKWLMFRAWLFGFPLHRYRYLIKCKLTKICIMNLTVTAIYEGRGPVTHIYPKGFAVSFSVTRSSLKFNLK